MSQDAQKILDAARQLPPDEREWVAEFLLIKDESLSAAEVESAWHAEIKGRLNEIDAGEVEMIPLEDVLARMDARRTRKQGE